MKKNRGGKKLQNICKTPSLPKTNQSIRNPEVANTIEVRLPAKEKSRLVTDTDWEELKDAVGGLDSFPKEFSEWSRVFISIAISFFIFSVTLGIEHKGNVFNLWYFYVFMIFTLIAFIVGIALIKKDAEKKQKIQTTKASISIILSRIEKKSSGVSLDYNTSNNAIFLDK